MFVTKKEFLKSRNTVKDLNHELLKLEFELRDIKKMLYQLECKHDDFNYILECDPHLASSRLYIKECTNCRKNMGYVHWNEKLKCEYTKAKDALNAAHRRGESHD